MTDSRSLERPDRHARGSALEFVANWDVLVVSGGSSRKRDHRIIKSNQEVLDRSFLTCIESFPRTLWWQSLH